MNFLLDHDVPADVGRVLAQAGHNVVLVRNVLSPSAPDSVVFGHATRQTLVLVTCNRDDFLNLARECNHAGLIVLIRRKSRIAECSRLLRLLRMAGVSGLQNNVNFA